ncbi:MAG: hypothetical protein IJ316_05090 [Clostridia bacterium]|nr:hypothetical protein [Clostridia bacterium]
MSNIFKRLVAGLAVVAMTVPVFSGCMKKEEQTTAVVDTIYIGTHYQAEDDPYWVNEITGEPVMNPDRIKAAQAALKTVKEELGVDIKWKQWPNGVTQDILQTVLAGDPYCHIAILSNGFQGRVMVQNVLQPIDEYMHIFTDDPDATWIASGKTFGKHYLFNRDLLYITDWPMVYNATMLEEVPSLKEADGTTLYPVELYERGEWTWSKFEWYLTQVKTYYTGKKADSGKEIVPYDARYQYTAVQAIHSNNAYLYNGEGMAFDTPEAIEACEYLDRLMTNGLVNCVQSKFGTSRDPGYLQSVDCFARGETVFTNCARWKMSSSSVALAERGESMGIIFFPRPDDVEYKPYNNEVHNDPNYGYKIAISCADSMGLLRGHNKEVSELALKAYKMYKVEFYKNYGGVDSIADYRATMEPTEAINFGVDIFHPEIGDKNLEIFKLLGSLSENEYGEAMNILWGWGVDIFGASVYANDGSPKYAIKVKSSKGNIEKSINTIGEALKSEGAKDSVAPGISQVNSNQPIVFEKGTNPDEIDWTTIFSASDNADGKYLMKWENGEILLKPNPTTTDDEEGSSKKKKYEYTKDLMKVVCDDIIDEETGEVTKKGVDFNTVGTYENGIQVIVIDTYGNKAVKNYTAYVYDADNTVPPTLKIKESYKALAVETDTSTVDWAGIFIEEAVDVNGINLKAFVSADVTALDVTQAGKYPVTVYVEDFAGNRSEQTIEVTVE